MREAFSIQTSFFRTGRPAQTVLQFGEPALSYDPPYARPIDDQLAWLLVRYLHPGAELVYHAPIETPIGTVVVDFLVKRGRHRVAFMAADEGTEVSGLPALEAHWQAQVLGSGAVDVLYVLGGERLAERAADALSVVAGWQPELFSPDGLSELAASATGISSLCAISGTGNDVRLRYGAAIEDVYHGEYFNWPESEPSEVTVSRRSGSALGVNRALCG